MAREAFGREQALHLGPVYSGSGGKLHRARLAPAVSEVCGTGALDPAQLAHGISVALYNTAFGLIVAIPSLIFWRYFRGRVDEYLLTLELSAERFARHLNNLRRA